MDQSDAPESLTVAEALKLGMAHHRAGRFAAARTVYAAIIAVQPQHFDALQLLGAVACAEGDAPTAIRLIRQALAINPAFAGAHANLGRALVEDGQLDAAIEAYRAAATLNPGAVNAGRSLLQFLLYVPGVGAERRFAEHLEFAARHQPAPERALPPPENDRSRDRRLRVGLLSSDLCAHPVARNLLPLLRCRDRAATDILCYAEVAAPDAMSEAILGYCDGWRSTIGLDDRAVAELIRRDRIDLLVVLAARFNDNRPLVACYRPAPIQISMFDGATTALRGIDHVMTDPVLSPPDSAEHFTEALARIPFLFNYPVFERSPPLVAPPVAISGAITFGSFNHRLKISEAAIDLWARVLSAVPGSSLILKYRAEYADPERQDRFRAAFGARGVDPARLRFLPGTDDSTAHLAAYGAVDIALDTTPFNGATTTFDALWMGVPTVTLAGETMTARMSASLLTAVGLSELIAASADGFVERAVALAGDVSRLTNLRAGLRDQVARSPLCDGPAYARSVESLWRSLWREWCAGASTSRPTEDA